MAGRLTRPNRAVPAPPAGRRPRARRGLRALVWVLALAVFTGLALLSGQADGLGSGSGTGTAAAAAPAPGAVPVAGPVVRPEPGEQIVAAPEDRPVLGTDDTGGGTACTAYNEQRDSLKLNRWTSFGLHTVDNSWLLKTRLFISMIASFMFMAAALLWRLLGMLMGFSYTFDMVCTAADPINATVRVLAGYAGWFLIPAWLFVLAAAIRRWSADGRQGPASAVRLVSVFMVATGLIFFIGDEAAENESDPTGRYTVPWMAATVQGWFTELSNALADLPTVDETNQVFYDHDPQYSGTMTCDGLSRTLDEMYQAENEDGFPGSATMQQVNRMWEASFIRSWMSAQLGEGTPEYPAPAHAACRVLEANSGVDVLEKLKAYDLSNGDPAGTTTPYVMRGFFIAPKGDLQRIAIAWGACMVDADLSQGADGIHTTPQWDQTDTSGKTAACALLLSDAPSDRVPDFLLGDQLDTFYFNGGDELNDKLGDCINEEGKSEACRYLWEHAEAWLGANQVDRLTQGLMSLIVAFVFLFALGPMAVGLMLISVALSGLAMLLPLTLLLFAMGLDQGKKLLRLTGAAVAGKFLFTLALSALSLLVDITYMAINASIDPDTPTPNLFEQVAQGAAPLFALWLFKRFSRIMGLGNISNMTGALGFAGAAALKAAGGGRTLDMFDQSSGRRIGSAIGGIGVGGRRLGNLDERALQHRALVNPVTRAMGRAAGRGAARAARPVTDTAQHLAETAAAGVRTATDDLRQKAGSGTPAQRAKAYAGMTAALAAGAALAPPTALAAGALLPLMLATGGAAAVRGAQAGAGRAHEIGRIAAGGRSPLDGAPRPGDVTGMPVAPDWRKASRQAENTQRNLAKIHDPDQQRAATAENTERSLNMMLARMYGGGHVDGLNSSFKGFANQLEKLQVLQELSRKTGLAPEEIILADNGLWIPKLAATDRVTGRLVFSEGTTPEQAGFFGHYLDRHTKERQIVNGVEETDDEYVARILATGVERGYVTPEGETVDVLAKNGIDVRNGQDRRRVAAFVSGGRDEDLSPLKVTAGHAERDALRAAREWTRRRGPNLADQFQRDLDAVQARLAEARAEIGDFGKFEIELTGGLRRNARQLDQDLRRTLANMNEVALEVRDLHRQKHSMDPAEFERVLKTEMPKLARRHDDFARDADELSGVFRDVVDALTQERGYWALEAKLMDPGNTLDTPQLVDEARRFQEALANERQAWHEEIDRLTGSIAPMPRNEIDAGALSAALKRFADRIERRVADERAGGQEVIDKLAELQEHFQRNSDLLRADPRRAASPAPTYNGRTLIGRHTR